MQSTQIKYSREFKTYYINVQLYNCKKIIIKKKTNTFPKKKNPINYQYKKPNILDKMND